MTDHISSRHSTASNQRQDNIHESSIQLRDITSLRASPGPQGKQPRFERPLFAFLLCTVSGIAHRAFFLIGDFRNFAATGLLYLTGVNEAGRYISWLPYFYSELLSRPMMQFSAYSAASFAVQSPFGFFSSFSHHFSESIPSTQYLA